MDSSQPRLTNTGHFRQEARLLHPPPSRSHRALQSHTWLHSDNLQTVFSFPITEIGLSSSFLCFLLFIILCIYSFWPPGSSLPLAGYSLVAGQASHCGGFSCFDLLFFSLPGLGHQWECFSFLRLGLVLLHKMRLYHLVLFPLFSPATRVLLFYFPPLVPFPFVSGLQLLKACSVYC